jgi:hypothetical protein
LRELDFENDDRIHAKVTASQKWRGSPETTERAVGHARGWMTRHSDTPSLILTAEDAVAPRIAMPVWTAAAQRESRRNHRSERGRKKCATEQRSGQFFHDHPPFPPLSYQF